MKHVTLKQARTKRRLTQMELASRARVSQSVITKLETGRALNPNYATVVKLAAALRVDPSHLVFGEVA